MAGSGMRRVVSETTGGNVPDASFLVLDIANHRGSCYSPGSLAGSGMDGSGGRRLLFFIPGEMFLLGRSPVHARARVNRSIVSWVTWEGVLK